MEYVRRIVDNEIDRRIEAFNAISIVGPKGCGKTRTAKERSKTAIEFQDEERRDGYLSVAEVQPTLLLKIQSQSCLMNGRTHLKYGEQYAKTVMIIRKLSEAII